MPIPNGIERGANVLWVDFLANGERLSDARERERLVRSAKETGITHLVVDAKIPYGHATYPSRHALHVSSWSDGRFNAWAGGDFLQDMIAEARTAGLKVLANVDVFAEGTKKTRDGLAFEKADWQVVYYSTETSNQSVYAEGYSDDTVFVNPIHPEVIEHQLSILQEIVEGYDIDGIVLDRCRYPNVFGDFGERSRIRFERYIGQTVACWPQDVMEVDLSNRTGNGKPGIRFGKWFPKWTEWRALNIKQFVKAARTAVKSIRPDCLFSIYVGSWYPLYYNEGVNWASEAYRADLPWTSPDYHLAAYADELDFIMTGCYYPEVLISEAVANGRPADWYSVEGAIRMSLEAIDGRIPVLASLFLKDYEGNVDQFRKALDMCRDRTHGVMLFDAVYVEQYNWWNDLRTFLVKGAE